MDILIITGSTGYHSENITFNGNGIDSKTFTVTVTDNNGCTGSDSALVYFTLCDGLSQNVNAASEISLYPNPNDGQFNLNIHLSSLDAKQNAQFNITLYNLEGEMIFNENYALNAGYDFNKSFDVAYLSKGLYLMKIESNNSINYRKIIVK